MTMNKNRLGTAIRLAAEVHENQYDKAGEPYILHCLAVMQMAGDRLPVGDPDREVLMIIGVLHDAVEDFRGNTNSRMHFEHRLHKEFGDAVYDALEALSHPRDRHEPYDEYIERVATNWFARQVKVCDLTHNMDPRRIPAHQIVDKDFERWDKYRKALIRLERE